MASPQRLGLLTMPFRPSKCPPGRTISRWFTRTRSCWRGRPSPVWGYWPARDSGGGPVAGLRRAQGNQAAPSKRPRPAGEFDLESLKRSQPPGRVKGGFAIAPGTQVVEATERFGVKHIPALRPIGDFLAEEQAGGISLRRIIITWPRQRIGAVDRVAPRHRFVVQQPISRVAAPTDVGFE